MSWSVSSVGKVAAVAASLERQFSLSTCLEPEETVRQAARALIAATVAAQTQPGAVVKVNASGSQSSWGGSSSTPGGFTNTLTITVEPLYGFVE